MKRFLGLSLIGMIVSTTLLTTSCTKYPEGSKFTLLTAKARIVNTWTLTGATSNGSSIMSYMPSIKVDIKKDETYSTTYSAGGISTTETGTWAFSSDKSKLILTASNGSVKTSEILMLKNKDLKVKDSDNTSSEVIYTYAGE